MVLIACLVVIKIQCISIDIAGMLFHHSLLFQRTMIQCVAHVAKNMDIKSSFFPKDRAFTGAL